MRTIIAAVALLAAGLSTGTASAAAETECSPYTSTQARVAEPGRWTYTYEVSWCVDKGEITAITPHVTPEANGTTCSWVTSAEEAYTPVKDGSGAWRAFNMGQFSCKNGDGTDGIANPWAIITVWPSGASSVLRKGIGDVIVE